MNKTLHCVCAAHAPLMPGLLTVGLAAHHCPACEGSLMAMADYRRWVPAPSHPASPDTALPVSDAPGVRACPGCGRLMERLKTGADLGFRVDRCAPCQLVWFDRGEWPALTQAGLATQLAELLSDAGQRQLQADEIKAGRAAALRARHGEAALAELNRVRAWLDQQPHPEELLSLLRTGG